MTMADILKAENHCPVCIQDRIFMQHHLDFDFKVDVGDHVGHCPCTPDLLPYQLKSGMAHHPKCKMSEKTCPDCGHLITDHCNPTETNIPGCRKVAALENYYPTQTKCPCTRTYESLVGFKYCPCNEWGSGVPIEHQHPYVHHFNCDGTGKLKTETQVETEMETELQLLVIDMGDSCVVKVEKGEHCDVQFGDGDNRNDIVYSAVPTIICASFTELRSAIDGEKPVPRIELDTDNDYRVYVADPDVQSEPICPETYNALSELAGRPLPIWEGGKWEELGHIDDHVYNNTDLRVWRYSR